MAHEWVVADRMFHRSSTRVSSRINTSSRRRRHRAWTALATWGCAGGPADTVATIGRTRRYSKSSRCFDYKTLGDELDAAGLPGDSMPALTIKPGSGEWSAYQAVRHIFHGPEWTKNVITPHEALHLRRRRAESSQTSRGSRPCARTPTTSSAPAATARRGWPRWSTPWARASSGRARHLRPVGRLGRLLRPRAAAVSRFRRTRDSGAAARDLAVRAQERVSHVQYETASVLRFAEDLFGLARLSKADARATSPGADCLDFTRKPRKFVPIQAPQGPEFFLRAAGRRADSGRQ